MARTPVIAIPARFSASASAHRHRALSTARALSEGVLRAGGEPVTVHPWAPEGHVTPDEVGARLAFADGVLLPGGGDLDPARYGQPVASDEVYDVDAEQDAFDLAVARWAVDAGVPLLAVCRGWQVVNVALGGELEQHMAEPHRHVVHDVAVDAGTELEKVVGSTTAASCYHHQRVSRLGEGLVPVARAADGTIEAAALPGAKGWFLAVQWHPEDTFTTDPDQLAVFRALVDAARR
ncbi:MAG: gamma-glutamyl-gamma-aminobutyrate hydrolase family protein [Actinobacteria bacterium]|jgi:putative glutamine amidotransferase|nr:gamma-glutamyl-gamma-aminobutyrate hydrolase family protein [Actinomycetota bacterium]